MRSTEIKTVRIFIPFCSNGDRERTTFHLNLQILFSAIEKPPVESFLNCDVQIYTSEKTLSGLKL